MQDMNVITFWNSLTWIYLLPGIMQLEGMAGLKLPRLRNSALHILDHFLPFAFQALPSFQITARQYTLLWAGNFGSCSLT